jgi:hypothetical protein
MRYAYRLTLSSPSSMMALATVTLTMCAPGAPSDNLPKWTQTRWGKRLVSIDLVNEKPTCNPSLLAHGLLSGALLFGALALYGSTWASINKLSDDWRVCAVIKGGNTSQAKGTPAALPDLQAVFANIDSLGGRASKNTVLTSQKARLKEQLKQLDIAQKAACSIGIFFFANRNAALTVSTAAGILTITSLAIVSKKGWEETNNTIINIGVSSGLILFTIWTFSQLYGQGINYESHKIKQALATDLINSVASATANHSAIGFPDPNSPSKPAPLDLNTFTGMTSLIRALDSKLQILNKPEFSGDTTFAEGSAKRIGDLLSSPGKGPQVSPASIKP